MGVRGTGGEGDEGTGAMRDEYDTIRLAEYDGGGDTDDTA